MAHRPAKKNKASNEAPTSADAEVDERNLVGLEDAVDLSFEDKFVIYWSENKNFILGCVSVLLLVIVGIQGTRIFLNYQQNQLGDAFNAAMASGQAEAFAQAHPGKQLGGFAALTIADEAFRSDDFERAAEYYAKAAKGLEVPELKGRARLGEAFAAIHGGDKAAGMEVLKAISRDLDVPESVRGEAVYTVAIDAFANQQQEVFERYAAQLEGMPEAAAWSQRLDYYQGQVN